MPMGAKGHIGLGKETEWGTAVASSIYLPFTGESIIQDKEAVQSSAIKGIVDKPKSYFGERNIGGDINVEVHPGSIGYLLRSVFGDPVTTQPDDVGAPNTYQHVFKPRQDDFHASCPLAPYTVEVHRDQSASKAFQYKGGVVNSLGFDFGISDKILKAVAGIIAKEEGEIAKTTASFETTDPFVWSDAVISIGGAQNNDLEKFSTKVNNYLKGKFSLNNTKLIGKLYRDAFRDFELGMEIDFVDRTEYDKFVAETEQVFQVKFEGAVIEDVQKYTLQIDLPVVKYKTFLPGNISGPGRIGCGVSGIVEYDTASSYAMQITLINKVESYTA